MKRLFWPVPGGSSNKTSNHRLAWWIVGRDRLTLCVVAFFAVGCLLDHVTTSYGLGSPAFTETNPLVNALLEQGTWHAIEIFIITIGVGLGLRSLSSMSGESSSLYLGMLTFAGLIRLFAGFQNLGVILQVIT
jgi:hypothetical protein